MPELDLNLGDEGDGGCIQEILTKASVTGVVNFDELLKCLSSRGVTDDDQIEDITVMLKDMGFNISY